MLPMTGAVAKRMATYADLERMPANERAEILGGEIQSSPAPLPRHSKAQGALRRFIGGPYDDDDGHGGPGGWWIFVEVDVAFGAHDVVRPDLSGWRRERLANPGDRRPIDIAPDWVCEVLSPSTTAIDRVHKRDLYATHGVHHYWIVDTDARTVEVFELRDGVWILSGNFDHTSTVALPPFDGLSLDIGRLFLPVDPR